MDENYNPWKVLAEKEIYHNAWIDVREYDVINPSGGNGIYGKVHFKNVATAVIPLDQDLNTYLVGQYRFVLSQYSWEVPEGGAPLGTDILDAAKRELKEETGLIAEEWTKLLDIHLSNSVSDEKGTVFLARHLTQEEPAPEETEQLKVKKVSFDEAYNMVESGIITDSMTVCAILKIKVLLLTGKIG